MKIPVYHLSGTVFIFLHFLTQIFAPLSGSPTMAIGFFLFGKTVVIYLFLSFVLSTITNFWISRIWGIKIVTRLIGKENLSKLDRFTKQHGYKTLFIMRLFLGGFEDLISYAAGLTSMKFTPYFLTSLLAIAPGTISWYLIADIFNLNTTQFATASIGMSIVYLIAYSVWEKYFHKHKSLG